MAYDAFLKLTDIKGESQDHKHKGEIDILSYSFGVSQTGSSAMGGGGGTGKVSFQDFHFIHAVDQSSPVLFQKCATGEHLKEALITVRKAGGDQLEYLKIKLEDVLISSVSSTGEEAEEAGLLLPAVNRAAAAEGERAAGQTFTTTAGQVFEKPTGQADELPMESVSLNFAKMHIDYQPQGPDGKAQGGAIHGGWDVKANQKV